MAKELYSEKTEISLLGLLIQNPNLMKKIIGFLEPDDFYFKKNSLLFTALLNSFKNHESVDEVLVSEELSKISNDSMKSWLEYISILISQKGIENNLNKYIEIIKDKKYVRQIEITLKDSIKLVSDGNITSVSEIIGRVESKIKNVSKSRDLKDFDNIEKLTIDYEKKLQKINEGGYQDGVRTKISSLDDKLGPLQGGQFIIIAARPSMGKTAFALEIAKNVAKNKNVALFSLEMPSEQLITRMISSESMIDSRRFLKQSGLNQMARQRVESGMNTVRSLNLWIDDSASLKIGELSWKARKLSDIHDINLIIIDYLQLIDSENNSGDNRQQAISEISRQLKSLARELNIPIIALSQLSRRVEQREDKRPQMSDIRESGAIEQDADIIMFLYREDYYKHSSEEKNNKPMSDLEVIISKHRNGATGSVKLGLDLRFGKISSIHTTYGKK